jgi:hypothetical protein
MRALGGPLRWLGAVAALAVLSSIWVGCASSQKNAAKPERSKHGVDCGIDEVREYFCDDLLPLSAALPAAAPYESCPSSIDSPASEYEPPPTIGYFDASFTEHTRKRSPPGHSCCFSWCNQVRLADPASPVARAACATPSAFREEYCMPELESGTRSSVGGAYERCPAAIAPPSKSVFGAASVALFDTSLTASHRGKGEVECCYAWCSQAPPGSGILKSTGSSPRPSPRAH